MVESKTPIPVPSVRTVSARQLSNLRSVHPTLLGGGQQRRESLPATHHPALRKQTSLLPPVNTPAKPPQAGAAVSAPDNGNHNPPSKSTTEALEDKISAWANRYEKMGMPELLEAHKLLVEWNADCSTRMAAMTRVLFKKCSGAQTAQAPANAGQGASRAER